MGRFLCSLNWSLLFNSLETCEDLLYVFQEMLQIGLDTLMPLRRVRVTSADAPWMSEKLKSLIQKRQEFFCKFGADSRLFKFYRNAVNRERKSCKANYYNSKIQQMKGKDPKAWWKEVKRISGMSSRTDDLLSKIKDDEVEGLSIPELANAINKAFLEPLEEYRLSTPLNLLPLEDDPEFLEISEERSFKLLSSLNPAKAAGPDGINNWLLKEYAEFLAFPVKTIINASFKQQRLPDIWKCADVTPLPKKNAIESLNNDLRPISLTPSMSKIAEDIVVRDYVKPAIVKVLDPNQFGAVPKSSTTIALISMIHEWTIATDGNGSTVRSILFDFRKAFDLIDHSILCNKLCDLDLPTSVINWIIDFLSNRFQRTKLADGCYSEWGSVPSGVPQGTKLGPWLFVLMINDLVLSGTCLWKYVDDTTASEVIKKGESSAAQRIADGVSVWSEKNKLQLNSDKCKELRISFSKKKQVFQPVEIDGKVLDVVTSAKLLGVTITSDLTWNEHINGVIKKAAKRLFFLVQLKRAKVSLDDLKLFYITCIRSTLDYAVPVFHLSLPKYLIHELELIQKRALAIMCPSFNYNEALTHLDLVSLHEHHRSLCKVFFNNIVNDKSHRLHHLLPPVRRNERYTFRHKRTFAIPRVKTERAKRSFIIASSLNVDNQL